MTTLAEFTTAFEIADAAYGITTGGDELSGYTPVPDGVWVDDDTGFQARLYKGDDGNYALSFAGTQDAQDWYQNLENFGWDQWQNNKSEILGFLSGITLEINTLSFVGHSLGGALAQYAAYDVVNDGRDIISADKVSLTTFNGLGGVLGLESEYGALYDANALAGADIHHYYDPSDLVAKLSPHLGGTSTTYQFIADTTPTFFLDAHRMGAIESYIVGGVIDSNLQVNQTYFDLDNSVPFVQALLGLANGSFDGEDYSVSDTEAISRMISLIGLIPVLQAYDATDTEWNELKGWLLDNTATALLGLDGIKKTIAIDTLDKIASSASSYLVKQKWAIPLITGGAQVVSYFNEFYLWMTDDGQVSGATKVLAHDILNNLVGADPLTDAEGVVWNDLITEYQAGKIINASSNISENRYINLFSHLGSLLGRPSDGSLIDTIELHSYIVKNGIAFDYILPVDEMTENGLTNWVSEDSLSGIIGRYAIVELMPFVISLSNSNPFISVDVINDSKYSLDNLSENYLADRSHFLLQLTDRNISNDLYRAARAGFNNELYYDYANNELVVTADVGVPYVYRNDYQKILQIKTNAKAFIFGDEYNNSITGGDQGDRVYGGAGDDFVQGGKGDDYIEGNQGVDFLFGGEGADDIHGGEGNDFLHGSDAVYTEDNTVDNLYGGAGNDVFYLNAGDQAFDGEGYDRYVVNTTDGSGRVIIDDADRKGTLVINGNVIAFALVESQGVWAEGIYQLSMEGDSLLITDSIYETEVEVKNFSDGDFGVRLESKPQPPATTGETIVTTDGDDVQWGGVANDHIQGLAGNDRLIGEEGDDHLEGGMGNDILDGDNLGVDPGDDFLEGGEGSDLLGGREGNDQLFAHSSSDLVGALGSDSTAAGVTRDFLAGGDGNDLLVGSTGSDLLSGGQGQDVIAGGAGVDYITGDSDLLPSDFYGAPWTMSYDEPSGSWTYVNITGTLSPLEGQRDVLFGGGGNDVIFAGGGDDYANGQGGDDLIAGQAGNDTLMGGSGDDIIDGDSGTSDLTGQYDGDDTLYGEDGNDELVGRGGDDVLDGGAGNDHLYGDLEQLSAVAHGNDILRGGEGNDYLEGHGGNDYLDGGSDDDRIFGDSNSLDPEYHGNDHLLGGDGTDLLVGGGGSDFLDGSAGDDTLYGDSGGAVAEYANSDDLRGGEGQDTIHGGFGNDRIEGGAGDDWLFGEEGEDTYTFGSNWGQDVIDDGAGASAIIFDESVNVADIELQSRGSDLVLTHTTTGDEVVVMNWQTGLSADRVNTISFADGTSWNEEDIANQAYSTVTGTDSDDTLLAQTTSQNLMGFLGADTYLIGSEPGNFTLIDDHADSQLSTVKFGLGIGDYDLSLEQLGTDLKVSWELNGGGSATVKDYFSNTEKWIFQSASGDEVSIPDLMDPDYGDTSQLDDFISSEWGRFKEFTYQALQDRVNMETTIDDPLNSEINIYGATGTGWLPRTFTKKSTNPFKPNQTHTVFFPKNSQVLTWGFNGSTAPTAVDFMQGHVEVVEQYGSDGSDNVSIIDRYDSGSEYVRGEIRIGYVDIGSALDAGLTTEVDWIEFDPSKFTSNSFFNTRVNVPVINFQYNFQIVHLGDGDDIAYDSDNIFSTTPMMLDGGSGNDELIGGRGKDFLYGAEGDDFLDGNWGDDTLAGGLGNDILRGGEYSDTYLVSVDSAGFDTIHDDGWFANRFSLSSDLPDAELILRQASDGDKNYIVNTLGNFWGNSNPSEEYYPIIDTLKINGDFDEVEIYSTESQGRPALLLTWADDTGGVLVLKRGEGDILGYGIERFQFNDGVYTQAELNTLAGAQDVPDLDFLSNQDVIDSPIDISMIPQLEDLEEHLMYSGEGGGANLEVGTYRDDNISADYDDSYLYGGLGNDQLSGRYGDDYLFGGSGNDDLFGSYGNDFLSGGAGDDVFVHYKYGGEDIIIDTEGYNTLEMLGYEYTTINDFTFEYSGNDLVIKYNFNDSVTIQDWKSNPSGIIDSFIFSFGDDHYSYSAAEIAGFVPPSVTEIIGSNSSDAIQGGESSDYIQGLGGNDIIEGLGGDDVIEGGQGSDILLGGGGDDTFIVEGSDIYSDTFNGGEGYDQILGGGGDDVIRVETFRDDNRVELIDGGTGYNVLAGHGYDTVMDLSETTLVNIDRINGGHGGDLIIGNDQGNVIVGGQHADTLYGNGGDDTFIVEGSDIYSDTFNGGEGYDQILGGDGDDVIRVETFRNDDRVELIDGGAGYNVLQGHGYDTVMDLSETMLVNIARIDGGNGSDRITGNDQDNVIVGGQHKDILHGNGGDDTFIVEGTDYYSDVFNGGEGYDQILGGDGDDVIRVETFRNDDRVELIDGGAGYNVLQGHGYDTIMDLSETMLVNIDRIDGGNGSDRITGNDQDNVIVGGQHKDILHGNGGDDTFIVEGSDSYSDTFNGGEGYDQVLGGDGDDVIRVETFRDENRVELIDGGAGYNVLQGHGYDTVMDLSETTLVNIDRIDGGNGYDRITGNDQDNVIFGGKHADSLQGSGGNDYVEGGLGSDTYKFGRGDDSDVINDYAESDTGSDDKVLFGQDVDFDQLWFQQMGSDLAVSIIGTEDRVTIQDWYLGAEYQVESFRTHSNDRLLAAQVDQLVSAMSSFAPPAAGQLELSDEYRTALGSDIAASWQTAS